MITADLFVVGILHVAVESAIFNLLHFPLSIKIGAICRCTQVPHASGQQYGTREAVSNEYVPIEAHFRLN